MVSSVPRNAAIRRSSSACTAWVPQMKRTEAMPYPQRSSAALRRLRPPGGDSASPR